jgi:5-methylcytosine-specific restriction endonuclease McrA
MNRSVRTFVRLRSGHRCEYCRLHESDQPFLSFHIEHIVAKKYYGSGDLDNLAWACLECNLGKSSNLS